MWDAGGESPGSELSSDLRRRTRYTYLDGNTKHRWEQQVRNRVWVPFPLYGFCYTLTTSTYTEQFSPQACPDPEPDPCAGGCPEPLYMCGEGEEVVLDECGCASCYSPIFVQLDQGPFEFSSAQNGVLFDMFGTGTRVRLAWPVSPNTAWLALDRNRNGVIDNGTELFGNTRRLDSGVMARSGYEVLADLDANDDSIIDAQDPSFDDLLTWEDRDRNGVSSSDELMDLNDASIVALHLDFSESRRQDRWGNRFRYRAKVDASRPPGMRFSYRRVSDRRPRHRIDPGCLWKQDEAGVACHDPQRLLSVENMTPPRGEQVDDCFATRRLPGQRDFADSPKPSPHGAAIAQSPGFR